MAIHDFIFKSGIWIGEGKVTFNVSPERVRYYTKWKIENEKDHKITCQQNVEMEGGESNVYNTFVFSDIQSTSFNVELISDVLGLVQGKGIIDAKTIAWEFRGHREFQGFEVYELKDHGDYMLHAEYSSVDQIRTIIDGRVWKKVLE